MPKHDSNSIQTDIAPEAIDHAARKLDNGAATPGGKPASSADSSSRVSDSQLQGSPLITIFALPKPFGRETDLIQRNAINSWARLRPNVEVLLIGDEDGIADTAKELGVRHAGGIKFNEHGTPLVNSAFEIAHRETRSPFLAYCNCDVILLKDFVRSIELLADNPTFSKFVAFGQRTDLKVENEIDFDQLHQIESLLDRTRRLGKLSSNVCKEYFVFNRELYNDVPAFAIGRGNWDNWMIHSAKHHNIPVVKLSKMVSAIHQAHDYSHASASRYSCYVSGDEASENLRLAGGRHLVSGSTANWRLTQTGLKRERPLLLNPSFWSDIPRFSRLMFSLLTG